MNQELEDLDPKLPSVKLWNSIRRSFRDLAFRMIPSDGSKLESLSNTCRLNFKDKLSKMQWLAYVEMARLLYLTEQNQEAFVIMGKSHVFVSLVGVEELVRCLQVCMDLSEIGHRIDWLLKGLEMCQDATVTPLLCEKEIECFSMLAEHLDQPRKVLDLRYPTHGVVLSTKIKALLQMQRPEDDIVQVFSNLCQLNNEPSSFAVILNSAHHLADKNLDLSLRAVEKVLQTIKQTSTLHQKLSLVKLDLIMRQEQPQTHSVVQMQCHDPSSVHDSVQSIKQSVDRWIAKKEYSKAIQMLDFAMQSLDHPDLLIMKAVCCCESNNHANALEILESLQEHTVSLEMQPIVTLLHYSIHLHSQKRELCHQHLKRLFAFKRPELFVKAAEMARESGRKDMLKMIFKEMVQSTQIHDKQMIQSFQVIYRCLVRLLYEQQEYSELLDFLEKDEQEWLYRICWNTGVHLSKDNQADTTKIARVFRLCLMMSAQHAFACATMYLFASLPQLRQWNPETDPDMGKEPLEMCHKLLELIEDASIISEDRNQSLAIYLNESAPLDLLKYCSDVVVHCTTSAQNLDLQHIAQCFRNLLECVLHDEQKLMVCLDEILNLIQTHKAIHAQYPQEEIDSHYQERVLQFVSLLPEEHELQSVKPLSDKCFDWSQNNKLAVCTAKGTASSTIIYNLTCDPADMQFCILEHETDYKYLIPDHMKQTLWSPFDSRLSCLLLQITTHGSVFVLREATGLEQKWIPYDGFPEFESITSGAWARSSQGLLLALSDTQTVSIVYFGSSINHFKLKSIKIDGEINNIYWGGATIEWNLGYLCISNKQGQTSFWPSKFTDGRLELGSPVHLHLNITKLQFYNNLFLCAQSNTLTIYENSGKLLYKVDLEVEDAIMDMICIQEQLRIYTHCANVFQLFIRDKSCELEDRTQELQETLQQESGDDLSRKQSYNHYIQPKQSCVHLCFRYQPTSVDILKTNLMKDEPFDFKYLLWDLFQHDTLLNAHRLRQCQQILCIIYQTQVAKLMIASVGELRTHALITNHYAKQIPQLEDGNSFDKILSEKAQVLHRQDVAVFDKCPACNALTHFYERCMSIHGA
ncbi:hypothetical protein EDD86DRAFT_245841 [Gorgonomyces haynaldii]|nr:hypothetical protein EDD86DRAFT_245841 [Gorgonomyces haynaldii]